MASVTVNDAIRVLNEAFAIDSDAIDALIHARVPCGEGLANHPTVQVGESDDGAYRVGVLGILNGIFGVDERGCGYIAASIEDDKLVGFVRYEPKGVSN